MNTANHPVMRALADGCQRLIARNATLAKIYLTAIGVLLRLTPEFPLKSNIVVSVGAMIWPPLRFSPRKVVLCDDVAVNMVPHVGEFDFRALLSRRLEYEAEVFAVLDARIDQYDAIIEIGANVGVYSLYFGSKFQSLDKTGPILVFEPSAKAYTRLRRNLDNNGLTNVTAFNCAIAKQDGFLTFYEPSGHLSNGSLSREFARHFSTQVAETLVVGVSGKQLSEPIGKPQRLLLKVDVEGAEQEVLESMESLICEAWPDIILEVLRGQEAALNALTFLREHYRFFNMSSTGLEEKASLVATTSRDYLLVPNHRVDAHGGVAGG